MFFYFFYNHLNFQPKTKKLIWIEVTDDMVADSIVFPRLIETSTKMVKIVVAYGAYDRSSYQKYLFDKRVSSCIPTRRDGKIREELGLEERNDFLEIMKNLGNHEEAF